MVKRKCPLCSTDKIVIKMVYVVDEGWKCLNCGNTNPYARKSKKVKV
jgi:hypothetical protein